MGRKDLRIFRCDRCRHAYIPQRSLAEVSEFHDGDYRLQYYRDETERANNAAGIIDERFHEVRSRFTLGRWNLIGHMFKPHHHVLDVGCGGGSFLRHIAPHVKRGHGLELSGWFVDYINANLPATASKTTLEDFETDDRFDVIVTWHCMEHTVDVGAFLDKAADLLVPGGKLMLEVPTINDWNRPPTGGFYNDSHVHYFSPESLATAVERRFAILETWDGVQPPATMLAALKK